MADVRQKGDGDAPIFLIGFMATGKTTVGRLVAQARGMAFFDLDEMIAGGAGSSVAEIFAREGEAGFRRREAEAVQKACTLTRTVVATGGGAACREENLASMLAGGRVVALSATPAEVLRRTGGASGRPLLDGKADPVGTAAALLAAREPFYARAHHSIDTVGKSPAAVAAEVLAALEGGGGDILGSTKR
ncbi:MAG: shikimate kinase [Myxococcales bacterium]|jgi:shikimate kinase|nr:shikimate kinase [Myxococcales bacterium]